ncbi:MAG: DNA internalization-related competence protein ComEC/Rec2, partial [Myxococcota bacterium]
PFVAGILLEDAAHLTPLPCGLAAGLGLALWLLRRRGALAGCGEVVLGVGLGALALGLRLNAPVPETGAEPVPFTVSSPPSRSGTGCNLNVFLHGRAAGAARLRAAPEACHLLPGAVAVARVRVEAPAAARNPGGSSRRAYWERRGVHSTGRARSPVLRVGDPPASFRARLEQVRRRIGAALDPPDRPSRSGALLRALVIGERAGLGDGVRDAFSRAGMSHLLAVSGLHVGWVFAVVRFLGGRLLGSLPSLAVLRRAGSLSTGMGAVCALGYALLTGPGIPALRAAAMAFAGTLAIVSGRPATAWSGLALAALVVLALEPAALFGPAFQLSFAAVAGIALWRPERGAWLGLLHCTLAAVLATAPFVAQLGGPLPSAGWLANLIAVPLFGAVLVPLALGTGIALTLLPELGALVLPVARHAAELGVRLVELLASPDLLALAGDRVTFATGLAAAGFGLRLLSFRHLRVALPLLFAAPVAIGVGLASARANSDAPPSLLFLDVGHGDAVLLRSGRGAWLVDTGPRLTGFDAGRHVVLPALRAEGVHRLDALVLTHPDRDHIGGAESVLRGIRVDEVWMSRVTLEAPAAAGLRRTAARLKIPVRLIASGDAWRAHGLGIRVLWPPRSRFVGSTNRASLVLRISVPGHCAMLPGDVPREVEILLAPRLAPCQILKLAHHGSASSTDPVWLKALAPEVAIVSAGRRSRSPLPHSQVRRRVRELGAELWETSRSGALRIALSGSGPRVVPYLAPGGAER